MPKNLIVRSCYAKTDEVYKHMSLIDDDIERREESRMEIEDAEEVIKAMKRGEAGIKSNNWRGVEKLGYDNHKC